jgi:hypothetical protein
MNTRKINGRISDTLEPFGLLWLVYHIERVLGGQELTREEAESLEEPVAVAIDLVGPVPELRTFKDAMRRADIHGPANDIVPGSLRDILRQYDESSLEK